jgi:hypothetical protein
VKINVNIDVNLDEFKKLLADCDEFRRLLVGSSTEDEAPMAEKTVGDGKGVKGYVPTITKPEPKAEVPMETVRAKLAALMQGGKQAEVKELLKRYGGDKLSDIPKENYSALLAEAEEI